MTKRLYVVFAIVGSSGLLITIVLTVIEGVKYRVREEQGLDPMWAPTWVAVTSYAGLGVLALAVVALTITAVVARVQQDRQYADNSIPSSGPSTT